MFSETLLSIQRNLEHNGLSMSCSNQVCVAFPIFFIFIFLFFFFIGGEEDRGREGRAYKWKQPNETQSDF